MFFILIALIGVMALTLDFGFVLLARRQMQTGVNSAAVEGLRGQGLAAFDANGEQLRRNNARNVLRLTYDDDFDLSGNTTTLGAGIDSSLIQGNGFQSTTIGPANTTLGEDLANRSTFIFRPDNYELNQANERHGDMVTGTFDPAAVHTEALDYVRLDFDPTASNSASFLARMRRTHDPDNLDEVAGVSSRGGGLPLLLARAGWMNEDASAAYSVRRDGVTVRSTAIADGVVARSVGVADLTMSPVLPGVAPIALSLRDWQNLTTGTIYELDTANGNLAVSMMAVVGKALRVNDTVSVQSAHPIPAIELTWPDANVIPDGTTESFYIPVFDTHTSTTGSITEDIVYGFGRIEMIRTGSSVTIERLTPIVAAENAASVIPPGWRTRLLSDYQSNATFAALSSGDQASALGEFVVHALALGRTVPDALLAPALVRSIP